ncbi:MAG: hypothetical protein ACFFBD_09080 [Candidatus Hodarchaeota archaeon]
MKHQVKNMNKFILGIACFEFGEKGIIPIVIDQKIKETMDSSNIQNMSHLYPMLFEVKLQGRRRMGGMLIGPLPVQKHESYLIYMYGNEIVNKKVKDARVIAADHKVATFTFVFFPSAERKYCSL